MHISSDRLVREESSVNGVKNFSGLLVRETKRIFLN
jgi:hypothetical protein